MNRSKPSTDVGGGEMNRDTSSVVSSAKSDAASVARSSRSTTCLPLSTGSRCCQSAADRLPGWHRHDPGVQLRLVRHLFHRQCPDLCRYCPAGRGAATSPNSCLIQGARLSKFEEPVERRVLLQVEARLTARQQCPRTMLSPSLAEPQTMLSPSLAEPQTMLSPSLAVPQTMLSPAAAVPTRCCRRRWCPRRCCRRRRCPRRCCRQHRRCPRRCCHRSRRRRTRCPTRCCRRRWCPRRCCRRRQPCPTRCCRRPVPQTMLSPSPAVPQTMLSPSAAVPQTMLSPQSPPPHAVPQTMLSPVSPSVLRRAPERC